MTMMTRLGSALAALGFVAAAVAAVPPPLLAAQTIEGIGAWDYRPLYAGRRAGMLIGADLLGLRGDELGAVRDLVVGADGRIQAAVVEASGMLGLGTAEFLAPWSEVEAGPDPDTIIIQAIDTDVPDLIRNSAKAGRGSGTWRAGGLIGRPVHLSQRSAFGTVNDLVFDQEGALLAIVVAPEEGGGPYAYPWSLATVDQAFGVVRLPTTPERLRALGPFDVQRMEDGMFARR